MPLLKSVSFLSLRKEWSFTIFSILWNETLLFPSFWRDVFVPTLLHFSLRFCSEPFSMGSCFRGGSHPASEGPQPNSHPLFWALRRPPPTMYITYKCLNTELKNTPLLFASKPCFSPGGLYFCEYKRNPPGSVVLKPGINFKSALIFLLPWRIIIDHKTFHTIVV